MRLPVGEWVRVSDVFSIESTESTCNLWIRSRGKCKVILDDISFRKLQSPVVTFTKANGAHTDKMINGVKTNVTMPVSETGMAILAVYKRDGNKISLADVKTHAITNANVTSGYTKFTLTSSVLSDFDTVNYYAKLLIFKDGVLTPVMDDVLLTK